MGWPQASAGVAYVSGGWLVISPWTALATSVHYLVKGEVGAWPLWALRS